jgi:membrane associated rhomboid family serine protease
MAYVVAERTGTSIFTIIYFLIGVVVALNRGYMVFGSLSDILSALLAIVLWPLLLFGVDLHLALGV